MLLICIIHVLIMIYSNTNWNQ